LQRDFFVFDDWPAQQLFRLGMDWQEYWWYPVSRFCKDLALNSAGFLSLSLSLSLSLKEGHSQAMNKDVKFNHNIKIK
jgi:hypothetical protein